MYYNLKLIRLELRKLNRLILKKNNKNQNFQNVLDT